MAHSSILSPESQITLPPEVRQHLGVKEGDRLEFVLEGSQTLIRPVPLNDNPFRRYLGVLAPVDGGESVRDWLQDLRDDNRP